MKCSQANIFVELAISPSDLVLLRIIYDHLSAEYAHAFHTTVMVGRAWLTREGGQIPPLSNQGLILPHFAPDHAREQMSKLHAQAMIHENCWFLLTYRKVLASRMYC